MVGLLKMKTFYENRLKNNMVRHLLKWFCTPPSRKSLCGSILYAKTF